MTTLLDSLCVSRSSAPPPPLTFSHVSASSIPSPSGLRSSLKLSHFRGFKLRPISTTRVASSPTLPSRIARRGGRVVCKAQDTSVEVTSITDANWQSQVLESESPVLVEFWAPWCGPCRMIHPIINELAKEYAGKMKCYKLNTDDSPLVASQYGIRSNPTVIIFKNGEKKEAIIGGVPKSTLTTSIEKFL